MLRNCLKHKIQLHKSLLSIKHSIANTFIKKGKCNTKKDNTNRQQITKAQQA